MSIHRSLKLKNSLARSRNVFRRIERLQILERDGKRSPEDSVYGLPKVRTRFKVAKRRKKEAKKEEAAEQQGEA